MKKRLDQLLVETYIKNKSKTYIQSLIVQRKVKVNGEIIDKPGHQVKEDALIFLSMKEEQFVCRAGYKLEKALNHFQIDLKNKIAMDAGLSTGGFTDCLLQRGIEKVYGIDVGYGQVHMRIREHPQVILMEKTNLRYVESLGELVDIVTLDLSFISVLKVMDAVKKITKPFHELVVLIKPQFESKREQVPKGGVILDEAVHKEVIETIKNGLKDRGYLSHGVIESPLLGGSGNKEFLGYFTSDLKNQD